MKTRIENMNKNFNKVGRPPRCRHDLGDLGIGIPVSMTVLCWVSVDRVLWASSIRHKYSPTLDDVFIRCVWRDERLSGRLFTYRTGLQRRQARTFDR